MIKKSPYRPKGKIHLLSLPLSLLISIFLFSTPSLQASNGELEYLAGELDRISEEARAATSQEARNRLAERVIRIEGRIDESAAIGLISPEERSNLRGRTSSIIVHGLQYPSPASEREMQLRGRYEAILSAANYASSRFRDERLERLRPLLERLRSLRRDLQESYYQGRIPESLWDELLLWIEQDRDRIEQEIGGLEEQAEPEQPSAPREAPPRTGPEQITPPTPSPPRPQEPTPVPEAGPAAPPAPEGPIVLPTLPRPPRPRPGEARPAPPERPPSPPRGGRGTRPMPPPPGERPRLGEARPEAPPAPEGPRPGEAVLGEPQPVPGPEAGPEAPPISAEEAQRIREEAVSLLCRATGLYNRYFESIQRKFTDARDAIQLPSLPLILDYLEGELGHPGVEDEQTGLQQSIEDMTRAANTTRRFAQECYEEAFSEARGNYTYLHGRIDSRLYYVRNRLSTLSGCIYEANAFIRHPRSDITNLRNEAEQAWSRAHFLFGEEIPESHIDYQRAREARERALGAWDALRNTQEFRQLSERVTALQQKYEFLSHALSVCQESFRENEPRAQSYIVEAETALERCRREKREGEEEREKAEGPAKKALDLSGTWLATQEGKPVGEWEIRIDKKKKGKITLIEPCQHAPGKVVEYSGSREGDTITARHIITDPDLVNPKSAPRKVLEAAIREYMPTWDLDLKVSKEGTTLEGKLIGFNVNYNPDTLEVAWVKPRFEKELVLKKKEKEEELAKGPPQAQECMERLRRFNHDVGEERSRGDEPENGRREFDESFFSTQREFNTRIAQGYDCYIRGAIEARSVRGEARATEAGTAEARETRAAPAQAVNTCLRLKHEALALHVTAGRAMYQFERVCNQYLETHGIMANAYNILTRTRQEVQACIGELGRLRDSTHEQRDLMNAAQENLDNLHNLQPPALDRNRLNEVKSNTIMRMEGRRTSLQEVANHLDCNNRNYRPVMSSEEQVYLDPPTQETLRRLEEMVRAADERRGWLVGILGRLQAGERLSEEEAQRLGTLQGLLSSGELSPPEENLLSQAIQERSSQEARERPFGEQPAREELTPEQQRRARGEVQRQEAMQRWREEALRRWRAGGLSPQDERRLHNQLQERQRQREELSPEEQEFLQRRPEAGERRERPARGGISGGLGLE